MTTNNKNTLKLIELIKDVKTFDQLYNITSTLSNDDKGYLFELITYYMYLISHILYVFNITSVKQ